MAHFSFRVENPVHTHFDATCLDTSWLICAIHIQSTAFEPIRPVERPLAAPQSNATRSPKVYEVSPPHIAFLL